MVIAGRTSQNTGGGQVVYTTETSTKDNPSATVVTMSNGNVTTTTTEKTGSGVKSDSTTSPVSTPTPENVPVFDAWNYLLVVLIVILIFEIVEHAT